MHHQLPRPLVLVVEDDLATRKLYAGALVEEGYEVIEAHNGFQASEKARELLPAVIVTDLGLPGIDGFELCRRLQQDVRTRQIPGSAIPGRSVSAAALARARAQGCHAVLFKPIDPARLVAELRGLPGHGI